MTPSLPAPFSLHGKHAVVTGAGSGIGRAIAERFAMHGAFVWLVDRDLAAAQNVEGLVRGTGGKSEAVAVDVADDAAVGAIAQRIGHIEILANVAGIGHVGNLLHTTAADFDRLHAVNVRGVFNLCRTFVPSMLERRAGSVVNMASVAGLVGLRDRLAYTATKFAVVGLTKALALDHSHTGVRFNAICPGRVETAFVKLRLAEYPDPEKAYREMSATQLNGRMATPEEVAALALYLAADESAMVTGSACAIDGGWTAGKP